MIKGLTAGEGILGGNFILEGSETKYGDYLGLGLKWSEEDLEFKNPYSNFIEIHNCQVFEFDTADKQRGQITYVNTLTEQHLTMSSHIHALDEFHYYNEGRMVAVNIFQTRNHIKIPKLLIQGDTEVVFNATCSILMRRIG